MIVECIMTGKREEVQQVVDSIGYQFSVLEDSDSKLPDMYKQVFPVHFRKVVVEKNQSALYLHNKKELITFLNLKKESILEHKVKVSLETIENLAKLSLIDELLEALG